MITFKVYRPAKSGICRVCQRTGDLEWRVGARICTACSTVVWTCLGSCLLSQLSEDDVFVLPLAREYKSYRLLGFYGSGMLFRARCVDDDGNVSDFLGATLAVRLRDYRVYGYFGVN